MTTTVTFTIKASGGNYTTLSAALAANVRNLVALDQIIVFECYNFECIDIVQITGWTTDVNRYIKITAPVGQRHNGKSREVTGSGFQLTANPTNPSIFAAIEIYNASVRLDGLCIRSARTDTTSMLLYSGSFASAQEIRVENCILYNNATIAVEPGAAMVTLSHANLTAVVRNCIIYHHAPLQTTLNTNLAAAAEVSYCTIVTQGGQFGTFSSSTTTYKNTYVGGHAFADFFPGPTNPLGSNNASADFSASTYFSNALNAAPVAAQFKNTATGTEDFHLADGVQLAEGGTPLVAVTTDINGLTRSATVPDIGADEWISNRMVPISDISNTGLWTDQAQGTTNLFRAIDEASPRDADFAASKFIPSVSLVKFRLSAPESGTPVVTTGHILRFRYRKSGGGTINLTWRVKVGATVVVSKTYSNIARTYLSDAVTLTTGQAALLAGNYALVDVELEATQV